MTEPQLIGALARAIGHCPEHAHLLIKEAVADFLRDEVSEFAAIKFEEAMAFAEPPARPGGYLDFDGVSL